ncbi:hypothetical protein [Mesorhizobium sp. M1136]
MRVEAFRLDEDRADLQVNGVLIHRSIWFTAFQADVICQTATPASA